MSTRPASCADAQQAIQELLDALVAAGAESALQVAVYRHGQLAVHAWSSAVRGPRVDGRTLFPVFSTGKGIAATAVNRLVERGLLQWDEPLVMRWPAFAAHGKHGITLGQVLAHVAGMPNLPGTGQLADLCDWDGMCAALAALPPVHAPGASFHYHAVSQSWLAGEPARRAAGQSFAQIVREEIALPLGIADELYFGIDDAAQARAVDAEPGGAIVTTAPPPEPRPEPVPWWMMPLEGFINDGGIRRAYIPASNGYMTAHAVAKHYAALIGEVDGVRLLRPDTVARATTLVDATRATAGGSARPYGMGYMLRGPPEDLGAVFGHDGYGGATGYADRRRGLGVGIAKARMGGEGSGRIQERIREVFPD